MLSFMRFPESPRHSKRADLVAGSKPCKGFTLLELLVNIAIIGIIAAIAMPAYFSFKEKAKIAQARAELREIQRAIEMLAIDTDMWPGNNNVNVIGPNEVFNLNLPNAGLVTTDGSYPNWNGPYIQSVQKDSWGTDYFFDPDYTIGNADYAVVGSFGPNKVGPNQYDSDDIYLILPTQ